MKIFKSKLELKKEILNIRNLSFVPTMGGLHKGHISLIKRSKKYQTKTLVSIFVNPKQFNDKKEFFSYPHNLQKDLILLKRLKVDIVFIPSFKDIFSFKTRKKIFLSKDSQKLCGKKRKGHFEGVLNIVNRYLEIVQPKFIFLGNKDFQQLHLITLHIFKRKINTKVISCKTIRENNGVPSSTRNEKLSYKQLQIASIVYKYLKNKKKFIKKELKVFKFNQFKKDLINIGVTKIDYIELYNLKTFKKPKYKKENFKIFIAYFLDKIRLIDNI